MKEGVDFEGPGVVDARWARGGADFEDVAASDRMVRALRSDPSVELVTSRLTRLEVRCKPLGTGNEAKRQPFLSTPMPGGKRAPKGEVGDPAHAFAAPA